jgi:hypothetical protein
MNVYNLSPQWRRRYQMARVLLGITFCGASLFFFFLVLFPSAFFSFDFKNPSASKNTLLWPHNSDGVSLGKGNLAQNTTLITDVATPANDYSLLSITLTPDKKSPRPLPQVGTVVIQKSYRTFFLPEGDPVTTPNPNTAPLQSSSLVSFADGVFLIDGDSIRPIGDASIFEGLGYHWEDVVATNEEDMGHFTKGKMVFLGNEHPDGTVLYTIDTHRYFLIFNHQKHLISDEDIAKTYLGNTHPILVTEKSLTEKMQCTLLPSGFFSTVFSCHTPIETLAHLLGNSYHLAVHFDQPVNLSSASVELSDTINQHNLKTSLSKIKQRILSNSLNSHRQK